MTKLLYHPNYNIGFFGLENLHPFDSKKYGRAYRLLQDSLGKRLAAHTLTPDRPVAQTELAAIHAPAYLQQLKSSRYVAQVLEIPPVRYLPGRLVDAFVLNRMRWAVRGSILAAQTAFSAGLAINLAGGYHHAKPAAGEGFCAYADIALAVHAVRQENLLTPTDTIVYIDLDAHQGNGVCHCFLTDENFYIFDIYNRDIYPAFDKTARDRIDWNLPVPSLCPTKTYLDLLKSELPAFLAALENRARGVRLAIYVAGTDVYQEDGLGRLGLSEAGVLARDLFVVDLLRRREIPTVMLLGGGYTRQSYQLVAHSVRRIWQENQSPV